MSITLPIEILIPLLEMDTFPSSLYIRYSDDNRDMFLSNNSISLQKEDALYNIKQGTLYGVSDGWRKHIKNFFDKGEVYTKFKERYPDLLKPEAVLSSKMEYKDEQVPPPIPWEEIIE